MSAIAELRRGFPQLEFKPTGDACALSAPQFVTLVREMNAKVEIDERGHEYVSAFTSSGGIRIYSTSVPPAGGSPA